LKFIGGTFLRNNVKNYRHDATPLKKERKENRKNENKLSYKPIWRNGNMFEVFEFFSSIMEFNASPSW
jgi:hypothetical protein